MKTVLKEIDKLLGYSFSAIKEYRNFQTRSKYYTKKFLERKSAYGAFKKVSEYDMILNELEINGFVVLKDAIDKTKLISIREHFNSYLDSGKSLLKVSNDSLRTKGDVNPTKVFLDEGVLSKGQNYCRIYTNNMALANPLISIPIIQEVAFSDCIIDLAGSYLGVFPALGSLNLRKSFANGLPEFDTQFFHVDPNSLRFLKFFMYLNDVDENGGPFTYVQGSHKKRFKGWQRKYRWTFEEMANIYGQGSIKKLTANLGDLIIADTNGFHRGEPLVSNDRTMLTLDYVIHEEFDGNSSRFKLSEEDYIKLGNKKPIADFLEIIK